MAELDIIQAIKSIELFNTLPENIISLLADEAELEVFPKNSIIMTQGQLGDKIYFIINGIAQAYILDKYGKETVIGELKSKNYFGELSILTDAPRSCSVRSLVGCTVISLSKKVFNQLSQSYPEIYLSLNKIISKRLADTINLVADKKNNYIILLIVQEDSSSCLAQFLDYFKKISQNKMTLLSNVDLKTFTPDNDEHYIFIKVPYKEYKSLSYQADYIINFVELNEHSFTLLPGSSTWQIENTVRKITKKTIGIALCSGGAPAAAHLGVMEALKAADIPIDYIVGSSAGALFGACFAFNINYEDILKHIMAENSRNPLKLILMHHSKNFSGLIAANYYRKIFKGFFGDVNIEEASIPFAAVASDLFTGKTIILDKGNAVEAILASNAAPIIMEPIRWHDMLLTDGVSTAPLPVQALVKNNIDIKIAVPIPQLDLSVSMKMNAKIPTVYIRSRSMMAEEMMNNSLELADVIIEPEVKGIKIVDWKNTQTVIEAGNKAAEIAIKRIKYLFLSK